MITDAEAADELAFQSGLVGDRTDDVARFDAVLVTHFDAIGALAFFGGVGAHRTVAKLTRRGAVLR